jgi:proteasome lid subunit RPN8/RPN11
MIVTPEEFAHIRRQAEAEYPNECCGVVLVREGSGERLLFPCRNVQDEYNAKDPEHYPRTSRTAYKIDDESLRRIFVEFDRDGYRVSVIYHSHIDAGAYFSPTDKAEALMKGEPRNPEATYVVLSVVEGKGVAAAAFAWNPQEKDFLVVELPGLPL